MSKAKLREGASFLRCMASEGVEEKWEGIKTTLQDICESSLGLVNNKKKEWVVSGKIIKLMWIALRMKLK
jgi:hypothetical protein